jgi:hypothetical protein
VLKERSSSPQERGYHNLSFVGFPKQPAAERVKQRGNFVSLFSQKRARRMSSTAVSYFSGAAFEQKRAMYLRSGVSQNVIFFQMNSCCFTAFIA